MGDKLRKFKINGQQEKHPWRPKKGKPLLDEDMACSEIHYPKRWESDCPEPEEKKDNETHPS